MASPTMTESSNMDEIIEHAIALLRNEKWRIRESIYCNRTAKTRQPIRPTQYLGDDSIDKHYSALTRALRKELNTSKQMPKKDDCNPWELSSEETKEGSLQNHTTSFESLRKPEIMMRIYSYLPPVDRICRLSLVDREFSRDTIRGGILCATYGPGFNLKQALLELQRWRSKLEYRISSGSKYESLDKISQMLEAANLTDGELLLFTGSNLVNTIVTPTERKRWMTTYVRDFLAREKEHQELRRQEQEQNGQYQGWLEDTVLVPKFLKRYFFDGTFNRLEQLMADVDFGQDLGSYEYRRIVMSRNRVDRYGNLIWCLPNLRPGCNLWLLDPDSGWKEHRFATCAMCSKVFHARNNGFVDPLGHHWHVCSNKSCVNDIRRRMSRRFPSWKSSLSV